MLQLTYSVGGVEKSLNKWVDWSSVKVSEQLNVPSTLMFKLNNSGGDFPLRVQPHAYVRLYSTHWKRSLFTGFINSAPALVPLGLSAAVSNSSKILFSLAVSCTSDEYLLNIKSVQFIPAFINQSQGAILASIANTLAPGFFNTDYITSGDIVPFFSYNPSQSWSEVAKTFADGIRYRYKVRDKLIYFVPYGDSALGISYDEETPEATFDPYGLKTSVFQVPMVNDVTIIGAVEAGNNREDYFIGDGFTGNFPLRHKVFEGASTLLLNDDWTGNDIDQQQWYLDDPGDQFNIGNGALNLVSSFGFPLGVSFLQMNNGLELAGGLDVEHGEFGWNDISHGIVGGVYVDETMSASACLAGYFISSSSGVELTASGAIGVVMQPTYNNQPVGPPVVSQSNHTYVLQTVFNAPSYVRYLTQYRTLAGNTYGGLALDLPGNITFIIQDSDIAAATGFYYQPVVTKSVVNNVPLPAFAVYGLINNIQLNCTVNYTVIAKMPLGTLQAWEGPLGLWMPTGIHLPLLPPGSGGYKGPVTPWPADASAMIFPPPLQRTTFVKNEVMGNGFEQQAAQITAGNSADTLAFYAQSLPTAGTPVRLQTWEAQAAISRMHDVASIAAEAIVVGDDGVRAATVSNLQPLPRTSEDCDHAAIAYLEDRTKTWYNGTYSITSYHLNQYTSDPVFWPTPGRFMYVNSPLRGVVKENMLVTQVTISVLDAVGNAQSTLTSNSTQVGEVLLFQLNFGPDLYLEKVLANFNDTNPPSILTEQDKANPINPRIPTQIDDSFLPDVKAVVGYPIKDTIVGVLMLDGFDFELEVRHDDAHWGQGATPDYIGSFNASGTFGFLGGHAAPHQGLATAFYKPPTFGGPSPILPPRITPITPTVGETFTPVNFTLPRQQYDQIWYMRYVDVAKGISSRRSKVLRVVYPQKPAPPKIDYSDSHYIQFDFAGDVRSIFGFELRALDDTTIIVQKPVESVGDLFIDLTRTKATSPFTPNVAIDSYINATGTIGQSGSRPLGTSPYQYWQDFRITSTLPSDAVILGIFPIVVVDSTVPGATIQSVNFKTISDPGFGQAIVNFRRDDPNFLLISSPTEFFSLTPAHPESPQTIGSAPIIGTFPNWGLQTGGTNLALIASQQISSQLTTSLFLNGLSATTIISAVGLAIYYNSASLPGIIDLQMPTPFDPSLIGGDSQTCIGWALPFAASGFPGSLGFVSETPAILTSELVFGEFLAYFFNHQWSYSNPTRVIIPPPPPPVLSEGFRFGLAVDVLSDVLTRQDILYQRWQASSTNDFTVPLVDVTNSAQFGSFQFNAPASSDIFVRSVRADYFASGGWSDTLTIPIGDLLASDFLTSQGSVPPTIIAGSGGIISYTGDSDLLVVTVSPFSVQYPDGSIFAVPQATETDTTTLDTTSPLTPNTGYFYYFSIPTPNVPSVALTVDIDGPYANTSSSALSFTISDGRTPLTQGPLQFFTATTSTGSSVGGGGGTYGSTSFCGVPASQIKMANGQLKKLRDLRVGEFVSDGAGGQERVVSTTTIKDVETHAVYLISGKMTCCGLAHTFRVNGGWEPLCDIIADRTLTGHYPHVDTEDGPELIVGIDEMITHTVILLKLAGPMHTYILDGIKTHNALYKSGA